MSSLSEIGTSYASQIARNALDTSATSGLRTDYKNSSDTELLEACKRFEEYFIEQIFKGAQKTIMRDESEESGSSSTLRSYWEDNLAQEIASQATATQSIGLAQQMFEQMKRNQGMTIEEVDAKRAADKKAADEGSTEKAAEV